MVGAVVSEQWKQNLGITVKAISESLSTLFTYEETGEEPFELMYWLAPGYSPYLIWTTEFVPAQAITVYPRFVLSECNSYQNCWNHDV